MGKISQECQDYVMNEIDKSLCLLFAYTLCICVHIDIYMFIKLLDTERDLNHTSEYTVYYTKCGLVVGLWQGEFIRCLFVAHIVKFVEKSTTEWIQQRKKITKRRRKRRYRRVVQCTTLIRRRYNM